MAHWGLGFEGFHPCLDSHAVRAFMWRTRALYLVDQGKMEYKVSRLEGELGFEMGSNDSELEEELVDEMDNFQEVQLGSLTPVV